MTPNEALEKWMGGMSLLDYFAAAAVLGNA